MDCHTFSKPLESDVLIGIIQDFYCYIGIACICVFKSLYVLNILFYIVPLEKDTNVMNLTFMTLESCVPPRREGSAKSPGGIISVVT